MKATKSILAQLFPLIAHFVRGVFATCNATTRGPLLSLGASGSIANALTFSVWKGIPTARGYTVPANPRTTAQVSQRTSMSDTVDSWRSFFTNAVGRAAWNTLAGFAPTAMSGFNMFTQNCIRAFQAGTPFGFFGNLSGVALTGVVLSMFDNDTGSASAEAGNFTVGWGSRKNATDFSADIAISAGTLTMPDLTGSFIAGDIIYVRIAKAIGSVASYRSGVIEITLT